VKNGLKHLKENNFFILEGNVSLIAGRSS